MSLESSEDTVSINGKKYDIDTRGSMSYGTFNRAFLLKLVRGGKDDLYLRKMISDDLFPYPIEFGAVVHASLFEITEFTNVDLTPPYTYVQDGEEYKKCSENEVCFGFLIGEIEVVNETERSAQDTRKAYEQD